MLIVVLYLIWSKGHQEPRNEIGSQSPVDEIFFLMKYEIIADTSYKKRAKVERHPIIFYVLFHCPTANIGHLEGDG